jgi:small subunit ribosomal protein S6
MSRLYEMMFVIDNNAVRAGWTEAKASVASLVQKHGGKLRTSRRWGERRLAYPIKRRRRGTYLLAYGEMEPLEVAGLRRELDLSETVLRYLVLSSEEVPAEELELTAAESEASFQVPEPPSDDALDADDLGDDDSGSGDDSDDEGSGDDSSDDSEDKEG